ncbi:actin [Podospora didyma]|uniref:Actin n=1 Tax=Podospora didyma TaxID=330526 RepID=A0AAE0U490_9PEZI|nr:actin [Podospora didyma]
MSSPSSSERVLIIDTGSYTTKSGFGGDTAPVSEIPSLVARPRHVMPCMLPYNPSRKDIYVGPEIEENLNRQLVLNVTSMLQGDNVRSWDDLEKVWHYVFDNELKAARDDNGWNLLHPVIMTEPTGWGIRDREKLAITLFETFECPALFSSTAAPLALYTCGRNTGLVIDSGHCATDVVPVYEGFPLRHAAEQFNVAGKDVGSYLQSLLAGRYLNLLGDKTHREEDLVRDIKETMCRVSPDFYSELIGGGGSEPKSYHLPDGRALAIRDEAFRAPEPIFTPLLGLHTAVLRAVEKSNSHLRSDLFQNIVLAGGNTLFPGFENRLQVELDATIPPSSIRAEIVTPPNPKYAAWRGASMLSVLSSFRNMCIPYEKYNEYGPVLVRRMCLGVGQTSENHRWL